VTGVQLQRSVEAVGTASPADHAYKPVPLSQIDSDLPLAVVTGEDSRFFLHGGINWKEVRKAIEPCRNDSELRGASGITQQLVKNLFMTTHSTSLRKTLEVPLAYAAELLLSKRRVLELYLNVIEWGPGVYEAKAAAQSHYGSSARRLTRPQAAALAACIPRPTRPASPDRGLVPGPHSPTHESNRQPPPLPGLTSGRRTRPPAPMRWRQYAHSERLNDHPLPRSLPDGPFP